MLFRSNLQFFEMAIDAVLKQVEAPAGAAFLDVGCGPCIHAVQLARRGHHVHAMDYSRGVLEHARANIANNRLEHRIYLHQGNLLQLPLEDETVDYMLCWAVLMHVPEIEKGIAEIARVLKPGGMLVIMENNMQSLQARAQRLLRRLIKGGAATINETDAGLEYWTEGEYGLLLTRRANIRWLLATLDTHGLRVMHHQAGQFTEAYTKLPTRMLVRAVQLFNRAWFKYARLPGPAFGNIIILAKR